jgi:hypothetical protein
MLLASKYEEIWAPEVRDFVYISDKAGPHTSSRFFSPQSEVCMYLNHSNLIPSRRPFTLCS